MDVSGEMQPDEAEVAWQAGTGGVGLALQPGTASVGEN
jgi:hypothetical protein